MKVEIKLDEGAIKPTMGTSGAAAYDLYVPKDTLIGEGRQVVKTGVHLAIPKGYCAIIQGRSGNSAKGIEVEYLGAVIRIDTDVEIGLIDSDYRGDVGVILNNHTTIPSSLLKKGQRVAQMRFVKVPDVELEEVSELDGTERGEGGFGSTGK